MLNNSIETLILVVMSDFVLQLEGEVWFDKIKHYIYVSLNNYYWYGM